MLSLNQDNLNVMLSYKADAPIIWSNVTRIFFSPCYRWKAVKLSIWRLAITTHFAMDTADLRIMVILIREKLLKQSDTKLQKNNDKMQQLA